MQAISSPDLVYFFFLSFFSLSDWDFGCGGLGPVCRIVVINHIITSSHHAVAFLFYFYLSSFSLVVFINIENDMLCNIMRG